MNLSNVFKNEEILSTEYIPKILKHRETQIQQIANNLKPINEGRKGQNTFIFGSSGIGKTSTIKYIFEEFENECQNIKPIYINCWDCNTSIAILSEITTRLGKFVSRRGLGKDEINERFLEAVKKNKENILICLDEVDQLIYKDSGTLYNLLRIKQYINKEITLVMISNNSHIFSNLENRILSSLNIEEIEFKPYNINEMKNILLERSKNAFIEFENTAITLAANKAINNGGDVRIGLQCLQNAGRLANKKDSTKLKLEFMKEVVKKMKNPKKEDIKKKLNENERIIFGLMEKNDDISFTKLYEKYCKKKENPVSIRMFQNYINHLEQVNMIKLSENKINGKRIIYKN